MEDKSFNFKNLFIRDFQSHKKKVSKYYISTQHIRAHCVSYY